MMEGSDRPARRGNFGSHLDHTFKRERLRFNPRREAAALVFPRQCHGRARWLTGARASVCYGLQLRAVPSSNQIGGRGVHSKMFSGQRRSSKDGVRRQGPNAFPQQWWEGAPRGRFNWVFAKQVQHNVGKLVGQSPWPKTPSRGGAMHGSGD
jgi:hypothetical protein